MEVWGRFSGLHNLRAARLLSPADSRKGGSLARAQLLCSPVSDLTKRKNRWNSMCPTWEAELRRGNPRQEEGPSRKNQGVSCKMLEEAAGGANGDGQKKSEEWGLNGPRRGITGTLTKADCTCKKKQRRVCHRIQKNCSRKTIGGQPS